MQIFDFLPFILLKALPRKSLYLAVQITIILLALLMYAVLLKVVPLGPIIYENINCGKCIIPPIHLFEVIPFVLYPIAIVIGAMLSAPVYHASQIFFPLSTEVWNSIYHGFINVTFVLQTLLIPITLSNIYFRNRFRI